MSYLVNSFNPGIYTIPAFNTYSPLFCCGFECGQSGNIFQHWQLGTGATFGTGTVRNGSRALRVNLAAQTSDTRWLGGNILVANLTVHRFYIRFATLPSADTFLFRVAPSVSTQVGVAFKASDSKIYAAHSNITFGASGIAVTTGVWYRIDCKIDVTAGAKAGSVQVDGAACGSVSAATGAGTNFTSFGSSIAVTGEWFIDDYIFSQTSADYPFGAGFVNHFVPTADGVHSTGAAGSFIKGAAGVNITGSTTDSYLLVDDTPLDDTTPDTNDYIAQTNDTGGGSLYVEHIFGPASGISVPTTAPRAVEVIVAYHQAATGGGNSTFKLNDQGTESTIVVLNAAGVTSTRYATKQYKDPPSGLGGWSLGGPGNFNDIRHRFGYSSDAAPDQYFDCAMIEAEFAG
jgi:hypothetical protein